MTFSKLYLHLILLLVLLVSCNERNEGVLQQDVTPVPAEAVSLNLPEVTFTEADKIENGLRSTLIYDRATALIDATPEDASIYISIYQFYNFSNLFDALKRAYSRNVHLHVMLDMSSHDEQLNTKNRATADALRAIGDKVEVVLVDNDAGSIAINHNKFILFSALLTDKGILHDVVFQTSHNFTRSGLYKIQDAVTLSHFGLYEAYHAYWVEMKRNAFSGMKFYDYREFSDVGTGVTAYFHPKRKDGVAFGEDTIIEILNDITEPAVTTIRIGMSLWAESRLSIASKLDELIALGATVEIITKNSNGETVSAAMESLAQKGAYVKVFNLTDDTKPKINIHSKFMLIEGVWKGKATNLVLMGSQNFSTNALRNNNEISLLFQDHEFYDSYKAYYELLKTLPGICCP